MTQTRGICDSSAINGLVDTLTVPEHSERPAEGHVGGSVVIRFIDDLIFHRTLVPPVRHRFCCARKFCEGGSWHGIDNSLVVLLADKIETVWTECFHAHELVAFTNDEPFQILCNPRAALAMDAICTLAAIKSDQNSRFLFSDLSRPSLHIERWLQACMQCPAQQAITDSCYHMAVFAGVILRIVIIIITYGILSFHNGKSWKDRGIGSKIYIIEVWDRMPAVEVA